MPTTPLPETMTKVSYILEKPAKIRLEKAAKKAGVSMSKYITQILIDAGVLPGKRKVA
jgi:hypothetical protein